MNVVSDEGDPSMASWPRDEVAAPSRLASATREPRACLREPARGDSEPPPAEPSLGELKARHRELHLCTRCTHHIVCGMAKSLDPNLLVTIVTCLAFDADDSDGSPTMCELLPVEPLPTT